MTFVKLPSAEVPQIIAKYGQDFEFSNIQFFPMWLREQDCAPEITELAHLESLLYSVENFSGNISDVKKIRIHPSCQFICLSYVALEVQKEPGMYAIWKTETVNIQRLDFTEAKILDRLQEGVAFKREELMLEQDKQALSRLIQRSLVLEN